MLEAGEWEGGGEAEDGELDDGALGLEDDEDDDDDNFGAFLGKEEKALMTAELFGVKGALARGNDGAGDDEEDEVEGDQAGQVEGLDVMMAKLLATKERAAELPEAQRRKLAAKAVREVMGG